MVGPIVYYGLVIFLCAIFLVIYTQKALRKIIAKIKSEHLKSSN